MSSKSLQRIEIISAMPLAATLIDVYKDNKSIIVTTWDQNLPNKFKLTNAALHVVFIDSAPWIYDALAQVVIGKGTVNADSKISNIALMSFRDASVFNDQLFNQVFTPHHIQLPLSLSEILKKCEEICDVSNNTVWRNDVHRARVVLDELKKDKTLGKCKKRIDAWELLSSLGTTDDRRLQEEHDVKDIAALLRFQSLIDYYYLITSKSTVEQPRKYLLIEDNVASFEDKLDVISQATGASFWVTKSGSKCEILYKNLRQHNLSKINLRNLIESKPSSASICPKTISEFDAILVDLIIHTDTDKDINGEDILALLHDTYPEVPTFVVTRSEEPDILARCVRARGADRVIPKRRILRLPHVFESYLSEGITPLLKLLNGVVYKDHKLDKELIRLYRIWNYEPGILWLGEKTFQGPEHSIEHHRGLWQLVSDVLSKDVWDTFKQNWIDAYTQQEFEADKKWKNAYKNEFEKANKKVKFEAEHILFCFLVAVWLHDIGCRGNGLYQRGPEVRPVHAYISGMLLDCYEDAKALGIGHLPKYLIELIADLCRYHQSTCPLTSEKLREINGDNSSSPTAGLYLLSLENKAPMLLPFIALLRLIDAIEHGWKRAGSTLLCETRLRDLYHETHYYQTIVEQNHSEHQKNEAETYLKWLGKQAGLLDKHRQVIEAHICMEATKTGWSFIPCYKFINNRNRMLKNELRDYINEEWQATGKYLEEIGIFWPAKASLNEDKDLIYIYKPK